jgi:hypothetical protein
MNNNENKSLCSLCNGKCCQQMGCHLSPEDLSEISVESITELLKTGNYSIDWWEGDIFNKDRDRSYYIRTRNVNSSVLDPSWGGKPCVLFVSRKGCSLSWENRPKGGKGVIPQDNFECKTVYSKPDSVRDWYQYQNILDEVVEWYYDS